MHQIIDGEAVGADYWDSIWPTHETPCLDPQLRALPAPRVPPRPGQAFLVLDAENGGKL